jgi:NAD(P)-dependent dehydrogenase (short-subunit alcohol dehydrogenase family)
VTSEEATGQIVAAISSAGDGLSLLINNAGIPGHGTSIEEISIPEITSVIETNCIGALRCAKACAPFLKRQENGVIVNISSRLGSLRGNAEGEFQKERHSYAYRIAKAALNMTTLCLAHDESLSGISVVSVHPGRMQTHLGGENAPHPAEQSAALLLNRLLAKDFQSGHFYDLYDGELAW